MTFRRLIDRLESLNIPYEVSYSNMTDQMVLAVEGASHKVTIEGRFSELKDVVERTLDVIEEEQDR